MQISFKSFQRFDRESVTYREAERDNICVITSWRRWAGRARAGRPRARPGTRGTSPAAPRTPAPACRPLQHTHTHPPHQHSQLIRGPSGALFHIQSAWWKAWAESSVSFNRVVTNGEYKKMHHGDPHSGDPLWCLCFIHWQKTTTRLSSRAGRCEINPHRALSSHVTNLRFPLQPQWMTQSKNTIHLLFNIKGQRSTNSKLAEYLFLGVDVNYLSPVIVQ